MNRNQIVPEGISQTRGFVPREFCPGDIMRHEFNGDWGRHVEVCSEAIICESGAIVTPDHPYPTRLPQQDVATPQERCGGGWSSDWATGPIETRRGRSRSQG